MRWGAIQPPHTGFRRQLDQPEARAGPESRHKVLLCVSHGELMRATVLVEEKYLRRGCSGNDPTCALSVVVHSMEWVDGDGKMRWVARDGQSLFDRILFLGSPVSFSADAAHLGIRGGCAYFIYSSRVFKYSLIDREAHLMQRMPLWLGSGMWLQPRPAPLPPSTKFKKRKMLKTRTSYVVKFVIQ